MNNKHRYAIFTVKSSEFLRALWIFQHPFGRPKPLCPRGRQFCVKTTVIQLIWQRELWPTLQLSTYPL